MKVRFVWKWFFLFSTNIATQSRGRLHVRLQYSYFGIGFGWDNLNFILFLTTPISWFYPNLTRSPLALACACFPRVFHVHHHWQVQVEQLYWLIVLLFVRVRVFQRVFLLLSKQKETNNILKWAKCSFLAKWSKQLGLPFGLDFIWALYFIQAKAE